MRTAYLITAYRNFAQLAELVRALNAPGARFFIHIDKKSVVPEDAPIHDLLRWENVRFTDRRKVYWGGYSQLLSVLDLYAAAHAVPEPFDVVHLLTGNDFPIKSNEYLHSFFARNPGRIFLKFFAVPHAGWKGSGGLERLQLYWPSKGTPFEKPRRKLMHRLQRLIGYRRPVATSLPLWAGGDWHTTTGAGVKCVLDFANRHPEYLEMFRYSRIPSEMFFHTILLDSPLRDLVVNDDLRYVDWETGPENPRVLRANDFHKLRESPKLFARKFDDEVDSGILRRVQSELRQSS